MIKYLSIAILLLFAWEFYVIALDNLKAMELCQQIHSYNTCSYNILR